MFLKTRDGIICDFCGTVYKNQFVYYSTRSVKYELVNNMRSMPEDAGLYADICTKCYDNLLDEVKKNLGKPQANKIKCDLSNTYKSGTFTYYIIYIDKVDVDRDRGKDSEVKATKNVMDLNVINGFESLLDKVQVVRRKIEDQGVWE